MLSHCDQQMIGNLFSPSLSCIYVRNAQLCMCMLTCINTFFYCIVHKMQLSPKFTFPMIQRNCCMTKPSSRYSNCLRMEDKGLLRVWNVTQRNVYAVCLPQVIIFVYNLEKKKRDYLLTKAFTFKLNKTRWRFSNDLNSCLFFLFFWCKYIH